MLKIEYVPLSEILHWPRNPKEHDVEQIKASIRRFGFRVPMVRDDRTGRLVAGHGRDIALKELHEAGEPAPKFVQPGDGALWFVPVVVGGSFDTEAEAEAFLIADNRSVELGGWNDELLASMIAGIGDDLTGVGYKEADIDAIVHDINAGSKQGLNPTQKKERFDNAEIRQIVMYLKGYEYDLTVQRLNEIAEKSGLEDNTTTILHIINFYMDSKEFQDA